jgi:hypothetical protein
VDLLKIVQKASERIGLDRPTAVVSSQETSVIQLRSLLEEVVQECETLGIWPDARVEAVWTLVAGSDQGELETLFPQGFAGIVPDTFYNRSTILKMTGPLSPQEWQNRLTIPSTGVPYMWTTLGGRLYLQPPPPGGEEVALEYWSRYLIRSASGTRQAEFLDDTDVVDVPEPVLISGLRWKWKQANGMEWLPEAQTWNRMAKVALARARPSRQAKLYGKSRDFIAPAVVIPTTDWAQ